MKKIAKFKIFKLRYLGPGKGFRGPLKGYLSKITYIFVRPDSFWEFSKFELSRSKFLRKTHFSGAKYGAQNWLSAFWASPNPYLYISGLFFFFGDQKNTPPPTKLQCIIIISIVIVIIIINIYQSSSLDVWHGKDVERSTNCQISLQRKWQNC